MARKYRKTERWNFPGEAHEATFSCYHRRPFLSRDYVCEWLADAINAAAIRHHMHIWAWVFMPEHVHLLYFPVREHYNISDFLGCFKKSVGRKATNHLREYNPEGLKQLATGQKRSPYRFWQAGGGYDRNSNDSHVIASMIDYIHGNPVRRDLVQYEADYKWSSAHYWETGEQGPVVINDIFIG